MCKEYASENDHPYADSLQRIQCLLQDVGSAVATPATTAREAHKKRIGGEFSGVHTRELEEWIDYYSDQLPPLENFILPGGEREGQFKCMMSLKVL